MKEELDTHLTHSRRLADIEVNLTTKPLICGFPTIESYELLVANEGNLAIICANAGVGKTALAAQIGLNVAKHSRVLYFSMEMSARGLKKRLLAVDAGIPVSKLKEPAFSTKLEDTQKRQESYKFDIVEDKNLTINDILSKCYDENNREKLALVIVDYLGIIDYKEGTSKHQAIGSAAKMLKNDLADKFKIPVIALAQLKSGFDFLYAKAKMEYEKAKQYPTGANSKILEIRPSLDDIAETKDIGRAADVVMFLHRPWKLNRDEDPSKTIVYVAKNRDGGEQDFELEFSSSLTKFIDKGVL